MLQDINGLALETIARVCPTVFAPEPHESRSARYGYVPTGQVLEALAEEGFVPTTVMTARSRNESRHGFEKHLIRLRQRDDLGYKNPLTREVVLSNSHDGTSAYNLYCGVFRLVCTNGCIMGDIENTLKVYHKGNIITEVVEGSLEIAKESAHVMEEIEEMKQIQLTRPEQLLLAEYTLKARFDEGENEDGTPKVIVYQPEDMLRAHRREDTANDLHTTYQVLQENAIKGHVTRRDRQGHRHTSREVQGIDQNVKVNRLLWEFTQRMKELKQS